MFKVVVLSILLLDLCSYLVADNTLLNGNCPIWHIKSNDVCKCGANLGGAISCDRAHNVLVEYGSCMTWDNVSESITVNHCPFSHHISKALCLQHRFHDIIKTSTNVSGPELNNITCENTTGNVHSVGSAGMAMDQQHFLMVSLVLTVMYTLTFGF